LKKWVAFRRDSGSIVGVFPACCVSVVSSLIGVPLLRTAGQGIGTRPGWAAVRGEGIGDLICA